MSAPIQPGQVATCSECGAKSEPAYTTHPERYKPRDALIVEWRNGARPQLEAALVLPTFCVACIDPMIHLPHHCKSCSAEIYWAKTRAGKSMPVDARESPDGTVILSDRHGTVVARVLRKGEVPPPGVKLRKPHHFTCPHAADWRATARARKDSTNG